MVHSCMKMVLALFFGNLQLMQGDVRSGNLGEGKDRTGTLNSRDASPETASQIQGSYYLKASDCWPKQA